MAKAKRVWGIVLTENGFNDLKDVLKHFVREGNTVQYILCKHVDMDYPYVHAIADVEKTDGSTFEAEIYVPHHHIRLVGSGTEKKQIGFILDDK